MKGKIALTIMVYTILYPTPTYQSGRKSVKGPSNIDPTYGK